METMFNLIFDSLICENCNKVFFFFFFLPGGGSRGRGGRSPPLFSLPPLSPLPSLPTPLLSLPPPRWRNN